MRVNLKKEAYRDFLALGSWVFYVLVIARALIKPYRPFADEIIIAGIFLIIIAIFIKNYDGYTARGLILSIFTTLFYQNKIFTAFAIIVFIGLIISSYFTGNNKTRILKGIVIGAICAIIGFYFSTIII